MKISIEQGPFSNGLQTVYRAISHGSSHPILTGILLTAQEGILHMSATDLETSIECVIPANVQLPGSLVLPGRQLVEIVNKIPSGEINVAAPEDRHQAILTWRSSEFVLNGYPPDQFPSLPTPDESTGFSVKSGLLDDALRRTSFAVATDDAMPIICGVHLEFQNGKLKATGTDGYRIAVWEQDMSGAQEVEVVLPKSGMTDLLRILNSTEPDHEVTISLSENHVFFETENGIKLSTVVLEGQYPDVLSMVSSPDGYTTEINVDRRELFGACERAALLSEEHRGVRPVRLHIMEDRLVFKASSAELGEAYDEVPCSVSGDTLDILFQSRYLLEGINNIEADELTFSFTDSEGAAQMEGSDDDNYSYIVLPMKPKS